MPVVRRLLSLFTLAAALTGTGCREEGDIRVARLDFIGVEQVNADALERALQTRAGSRLPWGRQRYFDRRAFEADLRRVEAFYRDRGFPDARVTSFDVALNDAQDAVSVTVHIAEGDPIRVAAIETVGFDVLPEADRERLREGLPLRVGRPLDRQLVVAARERAAAYLRDTGYPYATVGATEHDGGPRARRVVFEASPGTLARIGAIEVEGESSIGEDVIRRQLSFAPGDRYSRRELRESQRRLHALELFEFVNIESLERGSPQAPEVPVRVTVTEGDHRRVTAGVGYGTEERVRARLRWDHVNFLGGARHAGFEGKWSSLDRGVRAEYRQPALGHPHLSLTFDGQAWQAAEPVYSLNSFGGRVALRHQANVETFWSVSVSNEYQRSSITPAALEDFSIRDELIALGLDPRDGQSRGTLSAVAFDIARNTTASVLDARAGYVLAAHVEQAGGWLPGSFDYWAATTEGRHYRTAAGLVLANRLRLGTIDALGDPDRQVPFYKRYFLGGSSSLRGWGRFEVGPTSGFGLPIGGHTMLEGSSEMRFPIAGRVSAVAFLDYGNVWPGAWDFHVDDLRYAVGPGLRYLTGIGPIRVDAGYQLNPIPNLRVDGRPERRHWRLHLSVGQAF